jgi:hypothetical protein
MSNEATSDFWQDVEMIAYLMDGETLEYKFDALLGLRDAFKAATSHPDFDFRENLNDWAIYAVAHLLESLTQHLDPEYLAICDTLVMPVAKRLKDALVALDAGEDIAPPSHPVQ